MKTCSKCKIEKDESCFNKSSKNKDGLQVRCKDCNKQVLKNHYHNNLSHYRNKNDRRKENIRNYINSKKIKCAKCDETHVACLEFHHLKDKEINIAEICNLMWSIDRIVKELNKCIILCSNCHRKLHYNERNSTIV